jgi:L-asparaginase
MIRAVTLCVLGTGGTISAVLSDQHLRLLSVRDLCEELPADLPRFEARDIESAPSAGLAPSDMVTIATEAINALREGAGGVVVTHGTDTMELTSLLTDLLLGDGADLGAVVFTGAMRFASHQDPDGPQNLEDAIRLGANPTARGWGALVCFGGEVHRAAQVTKVETAGLQPFRSRRGVLGLVETSPLELPLPPSRPWDMDTRVETSVGLVRTYPGMSARALELVIEGQAGVVLEGFGVMNIPPNLVPVVKDAIGGGIAVVVASRAHTSGGLDQGPESRRTLHDLGAVGSYGLSADKAWIALMAGLARTDRHSDALRAWFSTIGGWAED